MSSIHRDYFVIIVFDCIGVFMNKKQFDDGPVEKASQ